MLYGREGRKGNDIIEGQNSIRRILLLQKPDSGIQSPLVVNLLTRHQVAVDRYPVFTQGFQIAVLTTFHHVKMVGTANKGNTTATGIYQVLGGLESSLITIGIELLQWTKDSMSDLVGINRQREGNTYNRETVGGIERAVLQSSYITDWLFQKHDDTKKRVLECFLEQAKGAMKGRNIKFQYILSDNSMKIMEIPGDEFAESSYGLVVDNSTDTQKLYGQMDTISQAMLQNGYSLSTLMKMYSSASLAEKTKLVEHEEKQHAQAQQEAQQAELQTKQQEIQMKQQIEMQKMQQQDMLNQRDNETKIQVAEINSKAEYLRLGIYSEENDEELVKEKLNIEREKLAEQIREFDRELHQKESEQKDKKEVELKKIEASKQKSSK